MRVSDQDRQLVKACLQWYRGRCPIRLPGVPRDMRVDPHDESEWAEWKMIPSTVTETEVAQLEAALPAPLPPLFVAYLTTRFVLLGSELGDYILPGLPSDEPLGQVKRFLARGDLRRAGYIPFAQTIYSDPVCFDCRRPNFEGDYPVVQFNCDWVNDADWETRGALEKHADEVAPTFRDFFTRLFSDEGL